jgi:hypothetical protein
MASVFNFLKNEAKFTLCFKKAWEEIGGQTVYEGKREIRPAHPS